MNVLALDLSLTRTGWATTNAVGTLVPPKGWTGVVRLLWLREQMRQMVRQPQPIPVPDLVIIEGYSYGVARGNALTQLGELGGIIRVLLHELGIPWVEVPPAVLKKYAANRGNATKAEVLVAAVKRLGYDGSDHNEADALWLRTMALDWYGCNESPVPKVQREGLAKIRWPEVGRKEAA